MKQMTFADAEYAGKRKQTCKELFLIEIDQVAPWSGLIKLIEPFYSKGEGGLPVYPLMTMLRGHLMQNWFECNCTSKMLEALVHVRLRTLITSQAGS